MPKSTGEKKGPFFLEMYGAMWKLTAISYRKFLRDVASGQCGELDDYGTRVCDEVINVTDIEPEEANNRLAAEGWERVEADTQCSNLVDDETCIERMANTKCNGCIRRMDEATR